MVFSMLYNNYMIFTFIRHAHTNVIPQDPPTEWMLSDQGVVDAVHLSSDPHIGHLELIYTSGQQKAIQTGVILAYPNMIPLHTHAGLTENTSFTSTYLGADYTRYVDQYYAHIIERIAEGETIDESLKRFDATLEEIESAHPQLNSIGIVSHGNILALFSSLYSEYSARELHDTIAMPDMCVFDYSLKSFVRFWGNISL